MVPAFENRTLKSPVFRWIWYSGVRYSDGYCNAGAVANFCTLKTFFCQSDKFKVKTIFLCWKKLLNQSGFKPQIRTHPRATQQGRTSVGGMSPFPRSQHRRNSGGGRIKKCTVLKTGLNQSWFFLSISDFFNQRTIPSHTLGIFSVFWEKASSLGWLLNRNIYYRKPIKTLAVPLTTTFLFISICNF